MQDWGISQNTEDMLDYVYDRLYATVHAIIYSTQRPSKQQSASKGSALPHLTVEEGASQYWNDYHL